MSSAAFPEVPLFGLDTLWFQVAGTLCNLACTHCFIACAPTNHSHGMMSLAQVRAYLAEAAALGVKDYYFTGGEPFLNKELMPMLQAALAQGPATVLTNGISIKPSTARALADLAAAAEYSLDLRVSLDGHDAASNDRIRGPGTFAQVMTALGHLAAAGINPALTVTEAAPDAASPAGRERFVRLLAEIGLARPRLKILPLLRLGAEVARDRGYASWETLRGYELDRPALEALQCSSSRMVTARGVYVCPILIDSPDARMGASLSESLRPFALSQAACHTCHTQGLTCRT